MARRMGRGSRLAAVAVGCGALLTVGLPSVASASAAPTAYRTGGSGVTAYGGWSAPMGGSSTTGYLPATSPAVSGFAAVPPTGADWSAVSAEWTVPHVSSSVKDGVMDQFVGTGGFGGGNLLAQLGTVVSTSPTGVESAAAFWDLDGPDHCTAFNGAYQRILRVPVQAGQFVEAVVVHSGYGRVSFSMSNLTTGTGVSFYESYSSACTWNVTTADWLYQRPSIGDGKYALLPDYGKNTMQATAARTSTGALYDVSELSGAYLYMEESASDVLATSGIKYQAEAPDFWHSSGNGA